MIFSRFRNALVAIGAAGVVLGMAGLPAQAADWAQSSPQSALTVSYNDWDMVIEGVTVEQSGRTQVAYQVIDKPVIRFIDDVIERLSAIDPSKLNRNEQLAYWLNLHNAVTLKLLATSGDKSAVDQVRGFPSSQGKLFAQPAVTVAGVALSPDQIVNEILRPNFKGTNFHYGLFTGAVGSPALPRKAFTGAQVETQLSEAARAFVNSKAGVQVRKGAVTLSSLYDWYKPDFGGSDQAVLQHVRQFANPKLLRDLDGASAIGGFDYDLRLSQFTPPTPISGYSSGGGSSQGLGGGS